MFAEDTGDTIGPEVDARVRTHVRLSFTKLYNLIGLVGHGVRPPL